MTGKEAAKVLKVNETTLSNWRSQGCGPPYYQARGHGRSRVLYRLKDLFEFLEGNKIVPEN